MKIFTRFVAVLLLLSLHSHALSVPARAEAPLPRVYSLSPDILAAAKTRATSDPGMLKSARDQLIADADEALTVKTLSVMDKTKVPPSGDKHDYMSLAPYWWPDPAKKDGLPYIRHDGRHNPDADKLESSDGRRLARLNATVETLSLAYYFTGQEAYAEHAAGLLRAWFLDPATRMNPNLNYGQAILGTNDGRGIGIIETGGLIKVADSIGLLAGSTSWTTKDQKGLESWFVRYLDWLLTSKNGRDEAKTVNNHGTWYDAQVAAFALFTGRIDLAKQTLESAKKKRIAKQIEPDGRMPLELERTNSLSYTAYNLTALETLADLGERAGVDLWGFQTADGRSIRKAVDFAASYADPTKPWPFPQIGKANRAALLPILAKADQHYHNPVYRTALTAASAASRKERFYLLTAESH